MPISRHPRSSLDAVRVRQRNIPRRQRRLPILRVRHQADDWTVRFQSQHLLAARHNWRIMTRIAERQRAVAQVVLRVEMWRTGWRRSVSYSDELSRASARAGLAGRPAVSPRAGARRVPSAALPKCLCPRRPPPQCPAPLRAAPRNPNSRHPVHGGEHIADTNIWPDTGGGWINGRGDDTMVMRRGYEHMVDFFTSFEWWKTQPHDAVVNGAYCLAQPGEIYAVYSPNDGTVRVGRDQSGRRETCARVEIVWHAEPARHGRIASRDPSAQWPGHR